jgi:ComEC/Rec2-related protein
MRNPVVSILIPYLVFILLFENQIFENALIVNIFLFYVILKIFTSSYFLVRKNKVILLGIFEVLLFFNLFENYDFRILQILEDIPKREILLNVKIKKKIYNLDYNYYVAKIKTAPKVNEHLVNQNILCRFESNELENLTEEKIQVKGVLSTEFINNQNLTTLKYCKILNKTEVKTTGTLVQLKLLVEKKLLISAKNEEELNAFLNAILLGNKNMLSNSQKLTFQNSGTLHLFAVSGLHIGFIYLIIKFLISLITYNRYISEIIIAIILFIYLDMVNYPPSALRACMMINIWQLSIVFFKRKSALCSLSISCLLILINDPSSIMEIGFQLSYTVVTSIIVFNIQIKKCIEKYKYTFSNFFINSLLTSYSAFCGSMLLVYDYFNIIVPGSIIINIIAIPIAFIFIIFIFLMLSLSIFIEIDYFSILFSGLYNILDYLLNIFTVSDLTYFKIEGKNDLDNSIHFFYLITILLLANLIKKNSTKIVIQFFFPTVLFLFYTLITI